MLQFGDPKTPLSGPDSRARRTALNLERRHIAAIVNGIGAPAQSRCNLADVAAWERSSDAGYPHRVVQMLSAVDAAASAMAARLVEDGVSRGASLIEIRRPSSIAPICGALGISHLFKGWSAESRAALDRDNGEFWDRLCDAAITRAGWIAGQNDKALTVVLESH